MNQRTCGRLISICCGLAIALMLAWAAELTASENLELAVQSANKSFETAFAGGVGADVGALYTEDATILPPNSDQGKYVVLWKKEKDGWKLHRDIWNTSTPLASASEAE